MVNTGTAVVAAATVSASILGSVILVEYRLFREARREGRKRKLQWVKKAEILADQIKRECTDISGMTAQRREAAVSSGSTNPLEERVQEFKDHLSETPDDVGKNTEFFMRDLWIKYSMAGVDSQSTDWSLITNDVDQRAEQVKTDLKRYREHLKSQSIVERFLDRPVEDYTDRDLD